jgi:hypothetical protein
MNAVNDMGLMFFYIMLLVMVYIVFYIMSAALNKYINDSPTSRYYQILLNNFLESARFSHTCETSLFSDLQ